MLLITGILTKLVVSYYTKPLCDITKAGARLFEPNSDRKQAVRILHLWDLVVREWSGGRARLGYLGDYGTCILPNGTVGSVVTQQAQQNKEI